MTWGQRLIEKNIAMSHIGRGEEDTKRPMFVETGEGKIFTPARLEKKDIRALVKRVYTEYKKKGGG